MRLTLIAVGRAKARPERDLFDYFARRITMPFELREVEEKKNFSGLELKRREANLLNAAVPEGAVRIALDEKGEDLTSREFAKKIGQWRDESIRDVAFIIGGANGLDAGFLKKCDHIMCLGKQTWPHMLVRSLVVEQLYRVQCILAGHPYHRD
jgi:23S rRNA (pseudouridine1915-N3)-methyltransferase